MDKVAITGINGFVGSHLALGLARQGHHVVGLGRKPTIYDHIYFDLMDSTFDFSQLKGCKALIHCAAAIDQNGWSQEEWINANYLGTKTIFEASGDAGVEKFICISSGAVYGTDIHRPMQESDKCNPINPYALGKYLGEQACMSGENAMKVSVLRLFFPYGSGQKGRMFNRLHESLRTPEIQLNQNGGPLTNPIHIDDVNDVILRFVTEDHQGIYNIAGKEVVLVEEILQRMAEIEGVKLSSKKITRSSVNPGPCVGDISKLKLELDWEPQISLREGLHRLLEREF